MAEKKAREADDARNTADLGRIKAEEDAKSFMNARLVEEEAKIQAQNARKAAEDAQQRAEADAKAKAEALEKALDELEKYRAESKSNTVATFASGYARPLDQNEFLVVADGNVVHISSNVESCKEYLNKNYEVGAPKPERMVCELRKGKVVEDPHTCGGQNQGDGLTAGFNKYWSDWQDIQRMNDIAQKWADQGN